MWPTNLLHAIDGPARETVGHLAAIQGGVELFQSLGPLERAGVQFAATLLLATVVLGLLQGYGARIVAKSRRSPVISSCVGVPTALVLGGLASGGYLLLDTNVGMFFGVIMVVVGATALPVLTALGFVAVGVSVATRLGRDRLWVGVIVGTLLSGLSALSVPVAVVVTGIAAILGTGAGVRVLFGAGGTTNPDERTIPPANKI
ncbi:hypothetical protein [Natronococcus wangiae]|uniref:hypothetical protein n=1 Tax=Natronococcus wangiae TaxID=3068275 RepID=UPI00273D1DE3|nr:hypothetical protein [Natronococcus sp. AD5]